MSTSVTPAPMVGAIEHIDPATMVVDTNIRTAAPLDKGFIDSIRENGVLTPILASRDAEGVVKVRAGQRRTLAAVEAGIPTVPVFIVDRETDAAQRIIEQIVENDQREALTDADRIQAWRQLELEGVSATKIAQRTGAKRDQVKTGLAVAANETGTAAVAEYGMTLDRAAALIEFEDDPELVATLTRYAVEDPDYFPIAVERERNDRIRNVLREKYEAEEAAKGHRILSEHPSWGQTPYSLRDLTTADGGEVSAEEVEGKDGVVAYISVRSNDEAIPIYFVDDPDALGLTVREGVRARTAQAGPMTEDQKAERKTLIANNKEWDAAETVRRDWLASLLTRKTLPKDATTVIARSLSAARHTVATSMQRGNSLATRLLGIEEAGYGDRIAGYLSEHPARALHVALAVTLGGIEDGTSRDTWRHPDAITAKYFQALHAWGYPLCSVEMIAATLADEG